MLLSKVLDDVGSEVFHYGFLFIDAGAFFPQRILEGRCHSTLQAIVLQALEKRKAGWGCYA